MVIGFPDEPTKDRLTHSLTVKIHHHVLGDPVYYLHTVWKFSTMLTFYSNKTMRESFKNGENYKEKRLPKYSLSFILNKIYSSDLKFLNRLIEIWITLYFKCEFDTFDIHTQLSKCHITTVKILETSTYIQNHGLIPLCQEWTEARIISLPFARTD